MRIRTFCGVLFALLLAVLVSYLSQANQSLLFEPLQLWEGRSVPLYGVLIAVFLLGFLPPVVALLMRTAAEELRAREARKGQRDQLSARAAFRRGVDYQADGQWALAERELATVVELDPEDFSGLLRFGQVLRSQGKIEEALEVHRRASVAFPGSVALLFELAEDYDLRGDREVASEIRNRIVRDFSEVGLRIAKRRRNAALERSAWSTAASWQEKVETLADDAMTADEAARESSIARGLRYQQALEHLEAERAEAALESLEEILDEEPLFVPAWILSGEAELFVGQEESALARWRQGFETTGSPVFLQRIEDHFIERSEPVRAIETLRHLIAEAESDLFPRFFLGRLYYRLEMHREALKLLEPLCERIESSPTLHLLLARIFDRRGDQDRAREHYRLCLQEAEIDRAELFCRSCDARYPDWRDRCDDCGSWNSIEVDLREERVSPQELGVRSAPVWSVYGSDFSD